MKMFMKKRQKRGMKNGRDKFESTCQNQSWTGCAWKNAKTDIMRCA